ncbi:uncharacterized protein LOC127259826 [Andrographis paniculata]|uniref:uncharacterized protein LOC127259826 n=1 Tax=Andrographis paniculata TaxID=175694 RepID=UPI0021E86069|nr:uncharacterized protein LOC127259826 [Andrographis paniculata]
MELSIASSGMHGPSIQESSKAKRYERYDAAKKGNNAPIKPFGKEALAIKATTKALVKIQKETSLIFQIQKDRRKLERSLEVDIKDEESYCLTTEKDDKAIREKSSEECATITFTDEDLIRIFLDGGATVNVLPLYTLQKLGIPVDQLFESRMTIHGYNQEGQRTLGTIRLRLLIDEMETNPLFYVIDAKTSFNVLLGRPWIHENGVVPSTWHQCFKYTQNGVTKKVLRDTKPYTEVESHFSDAKYFSTEAKESKVHEDVKAPQLKLGAKSRDKEKTPASGSADLLIEPLKDLTLPKTPLNPISPSQTRNGKEEKIEAMRLQEDKSFGPKAYKLFTKAGYNPNEESLLGKLPPQTTQGSRAGLGYMPQAPVRIAIKRATNYHITESESLSFNSPKKGKNTRVSVFRRLKPSLFTRLGLKINKEKNKMNFTSTKYVEMDEEIKSRFPSHMTRQTKMTIHCGKVLKAKWQTIVFTKPKEDNEESVASSCYITERGEETMIEEDAGNAPAALEKGVKAAVDELEEINLGIEDHPRPVYVSKELDVFAWSYKEMPSLDPKVAVHHLGVRKGARSMKQAQRRFRPELIPQIENEVNKLIEVGFIHEVKYPQWISNIVSVKKKNGQIRVCVDFRDLNKVCPKDDFLLPITELMIDATTAHEALSFMDGSSRYNQIRMAHEDEELTAFRTPKGNYC